MGAKEIALVVIVASVRVPLVGVPDGMRQGTGEKYKVSQH